VTLTADDGLGASVPQQPIRVTRELLHALAPMPATAMQLLAALDDPDAPLRTIGDLASRDVGISAALLRMANAPAFGTGKQVGDIPEALRVIGTGQARLVVLAFGIAAVSRRELLVYGLPAGSFLRHSEITANVAAAICRQLSLPDAGVAYAGGLLHDVGKVLLNALADREMVASASYRTLAVGMRAAAEPALALEQRAFGTDHAKVGRDIALLWRLPDSLVEALARHHTVEGSEPGSMGSIIALANAVAGQVDEDYPAAQRAPLPVQPLVPVEPLLTLAQEVMASKRPSS
jgi:putative nucleotidyltransferase with HDIG domain